MKKSFLIVGLALQGRQQVVPYLQQVHALEAIKKVLGSALQTGVQISRKAAGTLLLKKSRLVALPVPAQTL